MLDVVSKLKREPKTIIDKVVEYNLYLIAHNGSGYDSYIALNNLPQWRSVVSLIKNGAGIIFFERFNGYAAMLIKMKNSSKCSYRCGRLHSNSSFKKKSVIIFSRQY